MIDIGHVVPSVSVFDADGSPCALQHYWTARPVVLTFLRHMGCQFCKLFLGTLRSAYADFASNGVEVVAVAQGFAPQVTHFAQSLRIPFPMVADPTRAAFHAFGLRDGAINELLGPTVLARMAVAASKGVLPGIRAHVQAATSSNGSSLHQLGGTFVIAPGGILQYAHIATPIYSAPTIPELQAQIAQISR